MNHSLGVTSGDSQARSLSTSPQYWVNEMMASPIGQVLAATLMTRAVDVVSTSLCALYQYLPSDPLKFPMSTATQSTPAASNHFLMDALPALTEPYSPEAHREAGEQALERLREFIASAREARGLILRDTNHLSPQSDLMGVAALRLAMNREIVLLVDGWKPGGKPPYSIDYYRTGTEGYGYAYPLESKDLKSEFDFIATVFASNEGATFEWQVKNTVYGVGLLLGWIKAGGESFLADLEAQDAEVGAGIKRAYKLDVDYRDTIGKKFFSAEVVSLILGLGDAELKPGGAPSSESRRPFYLRMVKAMIAVSRSRGFSETYSEQTKDAFDAFEENPLTNWKALKLSATGDRELGWKRVYDETRALHGDVLPFVFITGDYHVRTIESWLDAETLPRSEL